MYKEPKVYSSYRKNNLGKTLYQTVLKYKPKKIIDFGVLYGYSTIAMAQALKDLGGGKIIGYDLWTDYPYRHTTLAEARKNLKKYQVDDLVKLKKIDFYQWIKKPEPFDLIHIDISNNGKIIELAYAKLKKLIDKGAVMLFEGGTRERDRVEWMIKYKKTPIYPLKVKLGYQFLDKRFPGLSVLRIQ